MSVEEHLGYYFFDKRLLNCALTRPAYAIEYSQPNQLCEDQEAYSLIGSALLDAVLTELLIRSGHRTQAAIVTRKIDLKQIEHLAKISQDLGIGFALKLGAEEKQQQAYNQPAVLAETLEAVIGSIYFDGGFSAARQVIQRLFKHAFLDQSDP